MKGRQLSAFLGKCAIPKPIVKPIVKLTKTVSAPHRLTGRRPVEYSIYPSSIVPSALSQIKIDGYWKPARGDILLTDKVVSEWANI